MTRDKFELIPRQKKKTKTREKWMNRKILYILFIYDSENGENEQKKEYINVYV